MALKQKIQLIRDARPIVYKYNTFVRSFTLLLLFLIFFYGLYILVNKVYADTPMFAKLLPLVISFIALDNIFRKLTSLNKVIFEEDYLKLSFLAKRAIIIPYDEIISMDLKKKISMYFTIVYKDAAGNKQYYTTPASFPHILEIIVNIADLATQAVVPENMKTLLDYLKANTDV